MTVAVALGCRRRNREPPRSHPSVRPGVLLVFAPQKCKHLLPYSCRSRHASDRSGKLGTISQDYITHPFLNAHNRGRDGTGACWRLTTATPVELSSGSRPTSAQAIVGPRDTQHSDTTTKPDGPRKGPETSARIIGVGHERPRTRLPLPSPSPEGSINLPLSRDASPRVGCAGPTQHPCQPHTEIERRADR